MTNYAWAGHILKINLTQGTIQIEESAPYVDDFLGGRGLGQSLLFQNLNADTPSLDPKSLLIFATGPLTGTRAPGSARLSISGKNLLTGGIGSSNVGGHFAPELKFAGFDAVIVEGKSPAPVYLLIQNNMGNIRDALHLKDKTTWETENELRKIHGQKARVLSIGPAGERMAPVGCIIVDRSHAAGRCGFATIMGSKNLKAIVVRGNLPIRIAAPEKFLSCVDKRDTDGLKLTWGNHKAVVQLIEKMAYGEGLGAILNQGAYRAANAIGKGADKYAVHIKGQDLVEAIRADKGWALGTVVAPRGGGHLNGATMTGMMKISPEKSMSVFGTPYGGEQETYRGKPKVVYYYELLKSVVDTIGLCYFTSKWCDLNFFGPEEYADLLNAATGRSFSGDDLMSLGRKVHNIEKAFNTLHAGFGKEDDYPPKRFFEEPVKTGPYKGSIFTEQEWQTMLEEYYILHGWDRKTGAQTEAILKELDLPFVLEKLKQAKKLPK